MKKLVFVFAVAALAVSFAACGNKANNNNDENADTTKTEIVINEAIAVGDTAVKAVEEAGEELVKEVEKAVK